MYNAGALTHSMTSNRFRKLEDLSGRGNIKLHFQGNQPVDINGITLQNPLSTSLKSVKETTLDEKQGDDVDGIVVKKTFYFEIPNHDNQHGEYVITTERPAMGENSVSSLELRDYYQGPPSDGKYTSHHIPLDKIET